MKELIDDVLFLSELETGRAIVSLGSTAAGTVVADVVRRLGDTADRAGVKIETEVEEGVRLPLRPRMLRMVVENLAANAIRYAADNGANRQ